MGRTARPISLYFRPSHKKLAQNALGLFLARAHIKKGWPIELRADPLTIFPFDFFFVVKKHFIFETIIN